MTTDQAISAINGAANPAALFGPDAKRRYRELSKLVHPDHVDVKSKTKAQAAFAKLSALYATLTGKPSSAPATIIGNWIIGESLASGDICDLYHASHKDGRAGIFKIARSPRDLDLVEAESFALKYMHAHKGGDNFRKYLPEVLDSMEASGRRVNVLTPAEGGMSLADICAVAGPLDFRHFVWMVNRALSALGFAHACGIIHGAVTPDHLLYHAQSHGLTLVDWCYSVTNESKKHVPAIAKGRAALYPPEVSRKEQPTPATDIYMLFASIKAMGAAIPKRFAAMFDLALVASPRSRPSSAWDLQERWAELAREEYGPPQFVELKIGNYYR